MNESHVRTGWPRTDRSVQFLKIKLVALTGRNKHGVSFRRGPNQRGQTAFS